MAHNGALNRNHRRALAALLSCHTVRAAAQEAGTNERTMWRYLALPEFRAALAQAEGELLDAAGRRLLDGQSRALDVLEAIMQTATKDSDKRQAAETWLAYSLKVRDSRTMEERLAELERRVFGGGRS